MTAPPFILSPVSLTEFPGTCPFTVGTTLQLTVDFSSCVAYWCEYPQLFAAIADGKDEEERAQAVLRWFIVSLHVTPPITE